MFVFRDAAAKNNSASSPRGLCVPFAQTLANTTEMGDELDERSSTPFSFNYADASHHFNVITDWEAGMGWGARLIDEKDDEWRMGKVCERWSAC